MEAIGTLAGGIAHDFNNLFTPIMAHAELGLLALEGGHAARDNLSPILDAAVRARDVVRQILVMTRKEGDGPLTAVPIGPLVTEIAGFFRATLPATIEVRSDVDPTCGPALGDASLLHQVLLNLCTNASSAMQEHGGVLTLSLERLAAGGEAAKLKLTVRDNGCGIPKHLLGRVFEPYFTTKPVGKGSGLGLAVVHGIVTRLGGEIRVESVLGQGTAFEVLLPETGAEVPRPAPGRRDTPKGQGQRVLAVDDEADVRKVLCAVLAALGYRVTEAAGSAEALEVFAASPDAFDVVLTDYTMPGMNGLDLAAKLLELRPGLRVLLGTGFAEAVDDEVVAKRGLRGLIMKPSSTQRLAEALHEVLSTSRPA